MSDRMTCVSYEMSSEKMFIWPWEVIKTRISHPNVFKIMSESAIYPTGQTFGKNTINVCVCVLIQ